RSICLPAPMRMPARVRWRCSCRSLMTSCNGVELSNRHSSLGRSLRGSITDCYLPDHPRGVMDEVNRAIGIDRRSGLDVRLKHVNAYRLSAYPRQEPDSVCESQGVRIQPGRIVSFGHNMASEKLQNSGQAALEPFPHTR